MFQNREEAGELLANALGNEAIDADMVVLTSLDAFPIGKRIALELEIPLRSLASDKLRIPGKEHLAFGAVSERGDIWLDDAMVEEFMISESFISQARYRTRRNINDQLEEVGLADKPDLKQQDLIIVSQGISSGMKTAATLGSAIKSGSGHKIIATPFVSENGVERLSSLMDEMICLEKFRFILSAREFYADAPSLKKNEIKQYFRA